MVACTGCGAFVSTPNTRSWVCDYCGRPNQAASEASSTRPSNRRKPAGVLATLTTFAHEDDFFVGDAIPPKKLANGAQACDARAQDVLALADLTVFGSAKNCVLFTEQGIHYRNDWSGKQPGTWFKAYADMNMEGADGGAHEVAVGAGGFINVSGSTLSKDELTAILRALAR